MLKFEVPCQINDIVYVVYDNVISKRKVSYILIGSLGVSIACINPKEKEKQYDVSLDMFGVNVFLSKELALESLKR